MRLLYVSAYIVDKNGNDGISKKIQNQIKAFENIDFKVDYIYRDSDGIEARLDGIVYNKKLNRVSYYFLFLIFCLQLLKERKYEYFYLRNISYETNVFILPFFLKKIKKKCINKIMEIPAYPFGGEVSTIKQKITISYYNILKKRFFKYIDLVVFMGENQNKIWGIPALRIINCVNFNDIEIIQYNQNYFLNNEINIVGLANLQNWHGYDRIIKGIYEYKHKSLSNIKVFFHIVGDNQPEYNNLKLLTDKLNLKNEIVFHGRLNNLEIKSLFKKMDIGVDSLARHRSGVNYNCSIKSKEYTAMNLPFIKSHSDDSFENLNFVKTIEADESPVDIEDLIDWKKKMGDFEMSIHDYAIKNFAWEKQFKNIVNFFENENR